MSKINLDKAYKSYRTKTDKYIDQGYHVNVLDKDEFAVAYNEEKIIAKLEGDPKRSIIRVIASDSRVGTAKGFKQYHTEKISEAKDVVNQLTSQLKSETDVTKRAALLEEQKTAKSEVRKLTNMTEKQFRQQFQTMDSVELWKMLFKQNDEVYDITRVQYNGIMGI